MISPQLVAVQGVSPDPLAIATHGFIASITKAKKKPKKPKLRRPPVTNVSVGGGGTGTVLWDWARDLTFKSDSEEQEEETIADLAFMHLDGAAIKAVADGTVETFVDGKGRQSIVIIADDGNRYWYPHIGESTVEDGESVRAGDRIGRTARNAPRAPMRLARTGRPELPPASRSRPVQPVFVEPRAKAPPRRIVRLVPIRSPTLGAPDQTPRRSVSPMKGVVIVFAGLIAAIYALASIDSRDRSR